MSSTDQYEALIYRGEAANLAVLRATLQQVDGNDRLTTLQSTALNEWLDPSLNEKLLFENWISVHASLNTGSNDDNDNSNVQDEDHEDQIEREDNRAEEATDCFVDTTDFTNVTCHVVLTSERIILCADNTNASDCDLVIHGSCIELHALADDPQPHLYLQINKDNVPWELLLMPTVGNSSGIEENDDCQGLYRALSQLVSLHPIDPNNEEDDDSDGYYNGSNDDDDDLIIGTLNLDNDTLDKYDYEDDDGDETPLTSNYERQAMLDRLDRLLIVPSEFEIVDDDDVQQQTDTRVITEGQFDDADENDSEDIF